MPRRDSVPLVCWWCGLTSDQAPLVIVQARTSDGEFIEVWCKPCHAIWWEEQVRLAEQNIRSPVLKDR